VTHRDRGPDSTLALVAEGYLFISRRCHRYGTDLFETRVLLQPAVCMRGEPAARIFYDNERFVRAGAAPSRVKKTLFGAGGVQGLDGVAHRHRKQLFMSTLSRAAAGALAGRFGEDWRAAIADWARADRVVLHDEVARLLAGAVCGWAGVPLPRADTARRTAELRAMIEAPAAIGPRYLRGRLARVNAERWIGDLITRVRRDAVDVPPDSALSAVASHRDPDGRLLDSRIAAVEVLNILRPTVAVARLVAFAALALEQNPTWRDRLRAGDTDLDTDMSVQEVRRFYPLFPVAVARVRAPFDWNGQHFPRHRRVVLDLYGTNHDPRLWTRPDVFDPDRFRGWPGDPFSLIPQGGGDHHQHHRCPGEWATIELMKTAVVALIRWMDYRVPDQDLRVSLRRMPTLPASGFVIAGVRPRISP
jgi:fatty-acid peroxygenase